MAVLFAPARPCAADVPPAGVAAHAYPAWWAGVGRAGWSPDAIQASGMPWTLAGLTMGAWSLEDPLTVAAVAPGIPEAQAPLAWYDSTRVVIGEGAAWRGFGAAIASAEAGMRPPGGRKPRAVYSMVSGDGGVERNGILVSRGDERSWLHAGAVAGKRSGVADLGPSGEHLWGVTTGTRRGDHVFAGAFSQRGMGESLLDSYQSVGESARGTSGQLGWDWARTGTQAGLHLSRSQDARVSFAPYGAASYSRRDAWTNTATLTVARQDADRTLEWRASWSESRARRVTAHVTRWEAWDHTAWSALRASAPLLGGAAEAALGGGFDGAVERDRERWQLAPSFVWRREVSGTRLRLFAERTLAPVWADLDESLGQKAFMQDVWVGGLDGGRGTPGKRSFDASVMAGRAGGRATLLRYPIRDYGLRVGGWAADPAPYGFLLAQASGEWNWRMLGADGRGYLLVNDESTLQGQVDPRSGAAIGVSSAYRLFTGDMAGRVRLQAAWVGERDSDARVPRFADVTLPGYFTFGASATMTVGDVTMLMRMDGLENERRELGWVNPAAAGLELARDSGRRFRFELSWPLFN